MVVKKDENRPFMDVNGMTKKQLFEVEYGEKQVKT